jgi:hypothetical protein
LLEVEIGHGQLNAKTVAQESSPDMQKSCVSLRAGSRGDATRTSMDECLMGNSEFVASEQTTEW